MANGNIVTLIVALLGATKLVLQSFGISIFVDNQIDDIANGVSAVVAVVGVLVNHFKGAKAVLPAPVVPTPAPIPVPVPVPTPAPAPATEPEQPKQ